MHNKWLASYIIDSTVQKDQCLSFSCGICSPRFRIGLQTAAGQAQIPERRRTVGLSRYIAASLFELEPESIFRQLEVTTLGTLGARGAKNRLQCALRLMMDEL